jgi:hypothetical protein
LLVALVVAAGCGPSDATLCAELTTNPCPAGKATLVDDMATCLNDLHASTCSGQYKALVECQIANPSCNTKNPDGSLTLDGPVECGDELDAFLGCGASGGG